MAIDDEMTRGEMAGESGEGKVPRRPATKVLAAAAVVLAVLVVGVALAMGGGFLPSSKKGAGVKVSIKADGWTEEVAPFGLAAVSESGEIVEEGELSPGEGVSLELADGVYALSITSIPTAADGKTTWSVPASQMVMVEGGVATPAEVSFTLLPIDPADQAAVEAVTASLPEAEREGALAHLAAKREDPSTDKVASKPARPAPPSAPSTPAGGSTANPGSKPAKKWGVVKEAWDEKVLVSAAWDETVVVKPAWTENKLVKDAWTETISHPAEYKTEKVKVGKYWVADDGTVFYNEDEAVDYAYEHGQALSTLPIYEERQVLVKDAWTEKIDHPAQYQTVQHPAQTKVVHHDAIYKTVHHDAVYGWI